MKSGVYILILGGMLLGLPLAGVHLTGEPVAPFLEFPPLTRNAGHAPFSPAVFVVLATLIVLSVQPILRRWLRSRSRAEPVDPARAFPAWGWAALFLGVLSWVVAWNRFSFFERVQLHTFTPQWLAYIVVVNALTFRRSGRCMMLDRPLTFASLFPVSAAFWWFFEYLNRFVENWHYSAATLSVTGVEYAVFATLPFSTVLPAVLATQELLRSYPVVDRAFSSAWRVSVPRPAWWAFGCLVVSSAGLAGLGIWPDLLFPLLWVSPLLIILSLDVLFDRGYLLGELARGDWRRVVTAAVAGLVCGVFWEMWNVNSLAHWVYSIPYVHAFQVFEMPVLGYAGYLPFGVECLLVGDLVQSGLRARSAAGALETELEPAWRSGLQNFEMGRAE